MEIRYLGTHRNNTKFTIIDFLKSRFFSVFVIFRYCGWLTIWGAVRSWSASAVPRASSNSLHGVLSMLFGFLVGNCIGIIENSKDKVFKVRKNLKICFEKTSKHQKFEINQIFQKIEILEFLNFWFSPMFFFRQNVRQNVRQFFRPNVFSDHFFFNIFSRKNIF